MLVVHGLLLCVATLLGSAQAQPQELVVRAPSTSQDAATRRFRVLAAPQLAGQKPGRLGVEIQPGQGSVRIGGVLSGSAAERAALRSGDQVIGFEGQKVESVDALIERVRSRRAGTEVQLRIRRTVALTLDAARRTPDGRLALGVYLGAGSDELVVSRVEDGYPAARSDLRAGDRIVALDGRPLRSYDELVKRMRAVDSSDSLELAVERDLRVRLDAAEDGPRTLEQLRFVPAPPAARAAPQPTGEASEFEQQLAREVRALTDDLRSLREELARLRSELSTRRRRQ